MRSVLIFGLALGVSSAATAQSLSDFDTSADGMVDMEEFTAAAEDGPLNYFATYDADKDGEVSQEEFSGYEFTRYDINGDGMLDPTEYEQSLDARGQAGVVAPLEEHDADGDGMINPDEYAASVREDFENVEEGEAAGFAEYDADQSGGLGQAEFREADFRRFDEDGDGMLNDAEFQRMTDEAGSRG